MEGDGGDAPPLTLLRSSRTNFIPPLKLARYLFLLQFHYAALRLNKMNTCDPQLRCFLKNPIRFLPFWESLKNSNPRVRLCLGRMG